MCPTTESRTSVENRSFILSFSIVASGRRPLLDAVLSLIVYGERIGRLVLTPLHYIEVGLMVAVFVSPPNRGSDLARRLIFLNRAWPHCNAHAPPGSIEIGDRFSDLP